MSGNIIRTELIDTGYGKHWVKLLQLKKNGPVQYVKEVEVNVEVTMDNNRGFLFADNTHVLATDSMKNTVYILAKQHGIPSIEDFAILLCKHFLLKYPHIAVTRAYIEELPWKRIVTAGKNHIHAFLMEREGTRTCEVKQERGAKPLVYAGLKDMMLMKTTASAFTNFVKDEYTTLPDAHDRLWCTVVQAKWLYKTADKIDFDAGWKDVKTCIIDVFAGPPETGEFSASVQNSLYLAEKKCLTRVPQIAQIEVVFPNLHYWAVDYTRFQQLEINDSPYHIYVPNEKPSGNIRATMLSKL